MNPLVFPALARFNDAVRQRKWPKAYQCILAAEILATPLREVVQTHVPASVTNLAQRRASRVH